MKHTENYSLNKIELTDSPPDITALNPNFDAIDAEMKRLTDKDAEIVTSINTVKNDYLPKTGGNVTNGLTIKNKTVAVSVNGSTADANGNITIDVGGDVQSVNGVQPDENGNVELDLGGDVQSVDGIEPDAEGNVALNASTRDEILEGAKRVTDVEVDAEVAKIEALQTGLARIETEVNDVVRSVNGKKGDVDIYDYPMINDGDDLNNYVTDGTYICLLSVIAESLQNAPTRVAFRLDVNPVGAKAAGKFQIVTAYDGGGVWLRHSDSGYWGEWIPIGGKQTARIVETWSNGTTWYRKYSDGWVEQGGKFAVMDTSNTTITLPVTMATTDYSIIGTGNSYYNTSGHFAPISKTTTYFTCGVGSDGGTGGWWEVKGKYAQ